MFKKEDILPLILAFITTVLIVTLGFSWLAKSKIGAFGLLAENSDSSDINSADHTSRLSDVRATTTIEAKSNLKATKAAVPNSQTQFSLPVIVPQGTSVKINGSANLNKINQALRTSFHQQYPGTVITTNGDGSTIGLDLLYSRDIDLAALDRPLSKAEEAAGLKQISIFNLESTSDSSDSDSLNSQMYYVYQEPLSPDAEAFLGYVFSKKGQQEIGKL